MTEFMGSKMEEKRRLNTMAMLKARISVRTACQLKRRILNLDAMTLSHSDVSLLFNRYQIALNLGFIDTISLTRNNISALPVALGALEKVCSISLSSNILVRLDPVVLKKIGTKLQRFYLQRNNLAVLGSELQYVKSLKRLFLDQNELRRLPPEIGLLGHLEWLSIDDNALTTLPVELTNCRSLQWLSAERNQINTLPDDLASLAFQLRYFSLLGNERLVSLPLSMSLLGDKMVTRNKLYQSQPGVLHGTNKNTGGVSVPSAAAPVDTTSSPYVVHRGKKHTAASTDPSNSTADQPHENSLGLDVRMDSVLIFPKNMTHGYPASSSAIDQHNYLNDHQQIVADMLFYLERIVLPLRVEFDATAHYPPAISVAELARCPRSGSKFTFKNSRTHCKLCGNVYCRREVQNRVLLAVLGECRVCYYCYESICQLQPWTKFVQRTYDPCSEIKELSDRELRGWTQQEKSLHLATHLKQISVLIEELVCAKSIFKSHIESMADRSSPTLSMLEQDMKLLEDRILRPVELKRNAGERISALQQDPESLDQLMLAVEQDDRQVILQMIHTLGSSIDNYHPGKNTTALHTAVTHGLVGTTEFLISQKATVNVCIRNSITPYHIAAKRRHLDLLPVLRKAGANIAALTLSGKSALHFLMGQRYDSDEEFEACFAECRLMLKAGVDINGKTDKDETPIHHACMENGGNERLIRFLAENGADLGACTQYGVSPLLFAIMSRNLKLFKLLHELGAEITTEIRENAGNVPSILRYIDPVGTANLMSLHNELRRGFLGDLQKGKIESSSEDHSFETLEGSEAISSSWKDDLLAKSGKPLSPSSLDGEREGSPSSTSPAVFQWMARTGTHDRSLTQQDQGGVDEGLDEDEGLEKSESGDLSISGSGLPQETPASNFRRGPSKQGWLVKQAGKATLTLGGKSVRKWQDRYFVLSENGLLAYYRQRKYVGVRPAGTVSLRTAIKVIPSTIRPLAFEIHSPGRIYYCQTDSEEIRQSWIDCLRVHLPNRGQDDY